MIIKNKKLLYSLCILFAIISVFLFSVSDDTEAKVIAILSLLFFGLGGIVTYILESEKSGILAKKIAGTLGCFIFVILSYSLLPFNHLYDNSSRYLPILGWVIGFGGILFFGFGFFRLMIKPFERKK